jgi:hypothetical protein
MRAKPHQLKCVGVWLPVDKQQVRLDMAVPEVFPIAAQRVVTVFFGQRLVIRQRLQDLDEIVLQRRPMRPFASRL